MKITNKELYELAQVFQKLNNHAFENVLVSYKVFKAVKIINEQLTNLQEFRRNLEKQYFIHEGEQIQFMPKSAEDPSEPLPLMQDDKTLSEYIEKLNILLETEVELIFDDLTFTFSQLEKSGVTPADFIYLEKFLTE